MAEAARCDFACANSINTGQTQLINQPSLSVKQLCCSERREVKSQVYVSLWLRCTYLACCPQNIGKKEDFFPLLISLRKRHSRSFPVAHITTGLIQPISCGTQFVWKTGGHGVIWQQTPLAAQGNSTLTWGPPAATKLLWTSNDNFIQNGFLKDVTALISKSMNTKFVTHLSDA